VLAALGYLLVQRGEVVQILLYLLLRQLLVAVEVGPALLRQLAAVQVEVLVVAEVHFQALLVHLGKAMRVGIIVAVRERLIIPRVVAVELALLAQIFRLVL
jgi:hypothetical protein